MALICYRISVIVRAGATGKVKKMSDTLSPKEPVLASIRVGDDSEPHLSLVPEKEVDLPDSSATGKADDPTAASTHRGAVNDTKLAGEDKTDVPRHSGNAEEARLESSFYDASPNFYVNLNSIPIPEDQSDSDSASEDVKHPPECTGRQKCIVTGIAVLAVLLLALLSVKIYTA